MTSVAEGMMSDSHTPTGDPQTVVDIVVPKVKKSKKVVAPEISDPTIRLHSKTKVVAPKKRMHENEAANDIQKKACYEDSVKNKLEKILKEKREAVEKMKEEKAEVLMKKEPHFKQDLKLARRVMMPISFQSLGLISFAMCAKCIARNRNRSAVQFPDKNHYIGFIMCPNCISRNRALLTVLSR
ncbi:MAG: hypothetical protein GY816_12090 [Cytophagales bacterium]|nr:hypothetical protein [Cytophagales bacterium]